MNQQKWNEKPCVLGDSCRNRRIAMVYILNSIRTNSARFYIWKKKSWFFLYSRWFIWFQVSRFSIVVQFLHLHCPLYAVISMHGALSTKEWWIQQTSLSSLLFVDLAAVRLNCALGYNEPGWVLLCLLCY